MLNTLGDSAKDNYIKQGGISEESDLDVSLGSHNTQYLPLYSTTHFEASPLAFPTINKTVSKKKFLLVSMAPDTRHLKR